MLIHMTWGLFLRRSGKNEILIRKGIVSPVIVALSSPYPTLSSTGVAFLFVYWVLLLSHIYVWRCLHGARALQRDLFRFLSHELSIEHEELQAPRVYVWHSLLHVVMEAVHATIPRVLRAERF